MRFEVPRPVAIFDLDDTLYPEQSYVSSGFDAVANFLDSTGVISADVARRFFLEALERDGRGRIFQSLIGEFRLRGISARTLVSVYRGHSPQISLDPASIPTLELCLDFCQGDVFLVTDGNRLVQRRKVRALGIEKYFRKLFFTRDYGLSAEKPSCKVFKEIQRLTNQSMSSFIFVGDDPTKDFECVLRNGGTAIRVMQGRLLDVVAHERLRPQFEVSNLSEARKRLTSEFSAKYSFSAQR